MPPSPDHESATVRRRVSPAGLALIRAFEGVCFEPQRLGEDRWVVGVSHVVDGDRPDPVDADAAERLLREDLAPVEAAIDEAILAPLTQSQFDALACLAFNIGLEAFRRSAVVACLNEGRPLDAAAGFDVWRWGEIDGRVGVLDAFVRRRAAEKALFLTPDGPVAAASTARRRPLDGGVVGRAPASAVRFGGDAATAEHSDGPTAIAPEAEKTQAPRPLGGDAGDHRPPELGNDQPLARSLDAPPALDPRAIVGRDIGARAFPGVVASDAATEPGSVAERPRAWATVAVGAVDVDGAEAALRARLQAGRVRETARWGWALAGIGGVLTLGGVYETASAGGGAGAWPAVAVAGALVAVASAYFAWRPDALWVQDGALAPSRRGTGSTPAAWGRAEGT